MSDAQPPTDSEAGQEISDELWAILQVWIKHGANGPSCAIALGLTAAKLLAAMEHTLDIEEQEAGLDHIRKVSLATYGSLRTRILEFEQERENERENQTETDAIEPGDGGPEDLLRH